MKKHKVKTAIKYAMSAYYKNGYTNTAHRVLTNILKEVDKVYAKQHSR